MMELSYINHLSSVSATQWNGLSDGRNPFVQHAFLNALETCDCLHPFGWQPLHIVVHEHDQLVGALPLYIKSNSYGEFVFDWAWASAYERSGRAYYPKLVCSIPYTPATGPRLLVHPEADQHTVKQWLVQGALQMAQQQKLSSLHYLFTNQEDTDFLRESGLMLRLGYQFHWDNADYRDFDHYLEQFTSKKRKQIKRERRDAQNSDVEIEILDGYQAQEHHWQAFHQFYSSTFERKSGIPTLSLAFFQTLAQTMPEAIVLVMAHNSQGYVAGAFNLRGTDALYGRHYGCIEHYRHLHFEICYYQTLEYCIAQKLQRFEAGAQGEHKLSRGFIPTPTWSAHWLADKPFSQLIQGFLQHETKAMLSDIEDLKTHAPFKQKSL